MRGRSAAEEVHADGVAGTRGDESGAYGGAAVATGGPGAGRRRTRTGVRRWIGRAAGRVWWGASTSSRRRQPTQRCCWPRRSSRRPQVGRKVACERRPVSVTVRPLRLAEAETCDAIVRVLLIVVGAEVAEAGVEDHASPAVVGAGGGPIGAPGERAERANGDERGELGGAVVG